MVLGSSEVTLTYLLVKRKRFPHYLLLVAFLISLGSVFAMDEKGEDPGSRKGERDSIRTRSKAINDKAEKARTESDTDDCGSDIDDSDNNESSSVVNPSTHPSVPGSDVHETSPRVAGPKEQGNVWKWEIEDLKQMHEEMKRNRDAARALLEKEIKRNRDAACALVEKSPRDNESEYQEIVKSLDIAFKALLEVERLSINPSILADAGLRKRDKDEVDHEVRCHSAIWEYAYSRAAALVKKMQQEELKYTEGALEDGKTAYYQKLANDFKGIIDLHTRILSVPMERRPELRSQAAEMIENVDKSSYYFDIFDTKQSASRAASNDLEASKRDSYHSRRLGYKDSRGATLEEKPEGPSDVEYKTAPLSKEEAVDEAMTVFQKASSEILELRELDEATPALKKLTSKDKERFFVETYNSAINNYKSALSAKPQDQASLNINFLSMITAKKELFKWKQKNARRNHTPLIIQTAYEGLISRHDQALEIYQQGWQLNAEGRAGEATYFYEIATTRHSIANIVEEIIEAYASNNQALVQEYESVVAEHAATETLFDKARSALQNYDREKESLNYWAGLLTRTLGVAHLSMIRAREDGKISFAKGYKKIYHNCQKALDLLKPFLEEGSSAAAGEGSSAAAEEDS